MKNHLVENALDELKTYFSPHASPFKIQIHYILLNCQAKETCYSAKCNNRRIL